MKTIVTVGFFTLYLAASNAFAANMRDDSRFNADGSLTIMEPTVAALDEHVGHFEASADPEGVCRLFGKNTFVAGTEKITTISWRRPTFLVRTAYFTDAASKQVRLRNIIGSVDVIESLTCQ